MNNIDLLQGLIELHIANTDRVSALKEGQDSIRIVENIKDLLVKWRTSIKNIKEEVRDRDGWFFELAQLEYLTNELEARLKGYMPCPPSYQ